MAEQPHAYQYNGGPVCWCGENHPKPDGYPFPESYWTPATGVHLDALYLEAWLGGALMPTTTLVHRRNAVHRLMDEASKNTIAGAWGSALADLADARRSLDAAIAETVDSARDPDETAPDQPLEWEKIGWCLSLTADEARERYGHRDCWDEGPCYICAEIVPSSEGWHREDHDGRRRHWCKAHRPVWSDPISVIAASLRPDDENPNEDIPAPYEPLT